MCSQVIFDPRRCHQNLLSENNDLLWLRQDIGAQQSHLAFGPFRNRELVCNEAHVVIVNIPIVCASHQLLHMDSNQNMMSTENISEQIVINSEMQGPSATQKW